MRYLRWPRAGAPLAVAGLAALAVGCRGSEAAPSRRLDATTLAAPASRLAFAWPSNAAGRRGGAPPPAAAPARAVPPYFTLSSSLALAAALGPSPGAAAPAPAAARGPCPDEGMAALGAYCIDRYEGHLVVSGPGGPEPWPHSRRPAAGVRYESRSEADAYPQGYLSRADAASACANAGKRLCTLAEWRRACQGPRNTPYPYGATARAGACNSGKPHLLTKWHGTDASAWTYEAFNSPSLNLEPGFLAKGGEYEECRSEEGVYDLVGNLHEWVSDLVPPALVTREPDEKGAYPPQSVRPGNGIFAGGFFSTAGQNGEGCAYVTLVHEPAYHDYSTGFRCCADARQTPGG